ncbi:hypothetical protein QTI66_34115 [Variovorax sp. J22R133]|uniref:hypothetical protein n=1 Tax=Variovorax brevis TaxID=3053503 RepID=UPI002579127C|nr:hypothetical protein [Variovorax sp. J22R133]MDM0117162.1 hypothetical protein [Variovorax sp. J22R133]
MANVSWAVCVLDSGRAMGESTLGLFNSPAAARVARARSSRKGVVEGSQMAAMFSWLRPNDLIWNYWVNHYLLGNKPPAFDILAWNADTTRLPARLHSDLLDIMEKNPYVNAGTMTIRGVPIDMSTVDIGADVIGGITDHVTPWRAAMRRLACSATTPPSCWPTRATCKAWSTRPARPRPFSPALRAAWSIPMNGPARPCARKEAGGPTGVHGSRNARVN